MSIFKAYDIRGIYPEELNDEIAYRIGSAAGEFFKANVVVGRDPRISSDPIFRSFSEGITEKGLDVIDIGTIDSPGLYFAVGHYGYKAGAIITASHNPKEYNGFKMCRESAIPVGGDSGLNDIKRIYTEDINKVKTEEKKGKIIKKNIRKDYLDHILKFYKPCRRKRVVIDCSNGAACVMLPLILEKVDIDAIAINNEMDGNFPAHEPNPLKEENLAQLKKTIRKENADFGVCFDGDADRLGVVSGKGDTIRNDFLTAMIAKRLLKEQKNETILYDLRSSKVVGEEIEKAGGRGVMCRVGHAFIKKQMREANGIFAGELSGHYYYRDNFFADSALITFMYLLSMDIDPTHLKKYWASGEVNVKTQNKDVFKRIEREFSGKGKIFYLDGISFESDDYWFNVRPSNTESLVRINVEAKERETMEKYKKILIEMVEE